MLFVPSRPWPLPVQDLGADEVVDYKNVRFEDRYRSSPFDVVVDTIGGAPGANLHV